jgi:hypothetical protein
MKRFRISAAPLAAGLAAITFATPAAATTVLACPAAFTASPGFVSCKYVTGNALGGDSTKIGKQEDAIESLLGLSAGSYSVNWSVVDPTKALFSYAGDPSTSTNLDGILTSSRPLFGRTVLGIHVGGGNPTIGNSTAFMLFNFTSPTTAIHLARGKAFSDATLYSTGVVPEPGTWAMLVLGFGVLGGAMRGARRRRPVLSPI